MDFFGIGGGELVVILIVALLIWGPEKLVDIARTTGKTMNAFKRAASDLTTQVTREVEEAKLQVGLKDLEKGLKSELKLDGESKPSLPATSVTSPAVSQPGAPHTESTDRSQVQP